MSVATGVICLAPMLNVTPSSPRTISGPMVTILVEAQFKQRGGGHGYTEGAGRDVGGHRTCHPYGQMSRSRLDHIR